MRNPAKQQGLPVQLRLAGMPLRINMFLATIAAVLLLYNISITKVDNLTRVVAVGATTLIFTGLFTNAVVSIGPQGIVRSYAPLRTRFLAWGAMGPTNYEHQYLYVVDLSNAKGKLQIPLYSINKEKFFRTVLEFAPEDCTLRQWVLENAAKSQSGS